MYSKSKILIIVLIFILMISIASFSQSNVYPLCKNRSGHDLILNSKMNPDFENYDVRNYNINLSLNPDTGFINGKVTIIFEVTKNNIQNIIINLNGLQIDSVIQRNNNLNFTRQQNEVNISLNQYMQTGNIDSFSVFYQGVPIKGMYFRNGRYNNRVIYTHNEPFDAQYWIPCKDDPADKSLIDIRVTVPQKFTAASNGSIIETTQVGLNEMCYHWREIYPISTYLIFVTAAEFDVVNDIFNWNYIEMPVQYYIYPEDLSRGESALTNTIEMLDFFSDYIGIYPFILEKYAMVEAPFQEAGAMENQTISLMDEPIIDNESVIAHELAHQWWGDAVTLTSFDNIWLNEGFATYFDALFVEHKYGEEAFRQRMVSSGSNAGNDGSVVYPIFNPPIKYLFGSAVYHKGAWVLHMLRNELGKDVFKSIVRAYYNNFSYGNATTEDFRIQCENVSGKSLITFFNQWVYSGGIPNIFASWNQNKKIVNIQLDQLQLETVYELNLDIKLIGVTRDTTFSVDLNSKNQDFTIAYFEPITQLIVDPDKKILNIDNSPVYSIPISSELIRLYPNPFNSELNIFYRVDRFQNVKIELWDILSKKVYTIMDEKKRIGTHSISYQANEIASGMYFCVLRSESNIDKRKVIFIK